jgi:hypothetical protein
MKKTSLVVSVFIGVVVVGLLAQWMLLSSTPRSRETFMQKEIGAPAGGTAMGPYDSVSISGVSGWLASEPAPEGASPVGQTQDGNLMFLSAPQVSPSCCPSPFSTDAGCVCLKESERDSMAHRASNKA